MISIHFTAPQLEQEFQGWDFTLKLREGLKSDCVICSFKDKDGFLIIEVSHLFRLLQMPVQEFLIYQVLYYGESEFEGYERLADADEKSFIRLVEKYGTDLSSILVYAASVFTTEFEYRNKRIELLNVMYGELMKVKSTLEFHELKNYSDGNR